MEHHRFRLLLSSLVALVAIQMQAEAQKLPRLVVCISVDELRTDYLRELSPMMSEGGFRRMMQAGRVYEEVDFPLYQINPASATATLFTGVYPKEHGIEAEELYFPNEGKSKHIFEDKAFLGNYTRDSFSPRALLSPTLGDRLKEASGGRALVYSIAPRADQAISAGGEWADGVYWLDEKIASWATSNYYKQMPQALERYNRSEDGPNKRLISGLVWKPKGHYTSPQLSYSDWAKPFKHRYQAKDAKAYRACGLVNEEVTNLALRLLEVAPYAEAKVPGLLTISYTAKARGVEELQAEDVDTYLRLDAELERLLKVLDKQFGLQNCLLSLSGTGYTSYTIQRDAQSDRFKRSVHIGRLTALVNMYLTALYGQGDWIKHNQNGRLYLNHKLIEAKKLELAKVQTEVSSFLSTAEGLRYAVPAHHLELTNDEELRHIRNSVAPRHRADVYWAVLPKWQVEDLTLNPRLQGYSRAIASPFIIMGAGVEPSKEPLPRLDVRDIVRIICSTLRIRPPNA